MKELMSGNEAIARGAYEAGVRVGSAYPGTPSTEIFENLEVYTKEMYAEWAPNEKVAAEVAYGASIAGVRALCAMKHVGVNVAADPIFTASYNGVGGGFVIVSADDPGMHSSQNEQDNRHYARAAMLPMLEPTDSQDCLDFMKEAFNISELFDTPVLFRVTTRVCHSKSLVSCGERKEVPAKEYHRDVKKFVSSPAAAYAHRPGVAARMKNMSEYASDSPLNQMELNERRVGVIATGIAYQYAKEVFPEGTSFLKLGFSYPLPERLIRSFAAEVETLYVIEELDPFVEEQIKALGINCIGKAQVPAYYELNPAILTQSLFGRQADFIKPEVDVIPRPPALCPGCPHRGFFYTLSKRRNTVIAGDIGCYTLGSADPLLAMDTVVCMGGGFTVAAGMDKAFKQSGVTDKTIFGVMGDSTFFHSGLTGAIEILYNKSKVIPCVLDNSTTSMTGQQENPGTGMCLNGEVASTVDIAGVLTAIGYQKIIVVDPQDLKAMQAAVNEAVAALEEGIMPAIISRRPCLLIKRLPQPKALCRVDRDKCRSCKACLRVGCPAVSMQEGKSQIDPALCVGCTVCLQVCPFSAIVMEE